MSLALPLTIMSWRVGMVNGIIYITTVKTQAGYKLLDGARAK